MNSFCLLFSISPHFFFFCGSSGIKIEPPLQCFWNSLHDWNILTGSFSVQSNEWYTWKFSSHTILIKFIYSVSFLMLRAETGWKALPYVSHSWGSLLEWILWCMWDVNGHTRQTRQTLCTKLAQSHFYALNKILSVLTYQDASYSEIYILRL